MVVGTCRITLAIPENDSLKGKRSVCLLYTSDAADE